jgi:hypothetical protein
MRVLAQMPSQRKWVLPQRQFRMPVKKVANAEQTEKEKERPLQWQADTERYLLEIDRQTKRSFKTPARFPILQVSIYDGVSNSRTVVDGPRST